MTSTIIMMITFILLAAIAVVGLASCLWSDWQQARDLETLRKDMRRQ